MGFILILLAIGTLPFLLPYSIRKIKVRSQRSYDESRLIYDVVLPTGLSEDRVQAFLRAVGGNLRTGMGRWYGTPTIAFETHYTDKGIYHRLRVPESIAGYIVAELQTSVPGVDVTPVEDEEPVVWTDGVELAMSNGARTLRIANVKDMAARILGSVPMVETDEHVVLQWVISHSDRKKQTSKDRVASSDFSIWRAVILGTQAGQPEVQDRKAKESEQNFTAIGRVGVVAEPARARQLIAGVVRALRAENDDNHIVPKPLRDVTAVESASTPLMLGCQFTVSELTPMIAWPIGDPVIPGLRQGATRRLPATEAISRTGRVLGHSNIPGRERPIAISYDEVDKHEIVIGMVGSGKSVLMANSAAQDMQHGYGVIVLDASPSVSPQSLYNRALGLVPPERVGDVITINVAEDVDYPVAFNVLDQGRGAIDQVTGVFESLYPEVASGVSVRDLLYHGLATLIEAGGYTLVDLAYLISPRNDAERKWADQVISSVSDPELKDFWNRDDIKIRSDKKREAEWSRYVAPLHRRLWQLAGRPEARHMLGQTKSKIDLEQVLRENKILLISLAGLPSETAELLGTLITDSLWTAAQGLTPEKGNGFYLDEFQVSARLKSGLESMLRLARKHKLWLCMGTQYTHTLKPDLKQAIKNSTGTRIIFETGADEASIWRRELPVKGIEEHDFISLPKYTAIAQIAGLGRNSPVTFKALPPLPETGVASAILQRSRSLYGRPIAEVKHEITDRRQPRSITGNSSRPMPDWMDQQTGVGDEDSQ